MSLLISKTPGITMMAKPISTPIDSGKLTPKFGYLKRETMPTKIKIAPRNVFIFLVFDCYELVLVV